MRSKILIVAMVVSTIATPSASVAEPIYAINSAENDAKIVKAIKAEIDTFTLPTKEETAKKQIEEYVKKLEAERKKKAEAAAKKKAAEEAAKRSAAAKAAATVSSSASIPGSNACVVAMKKVFPEHLWQTGYAIMMAESSARPNAIGGPNYNGTYDYGCWQINNTKRALDPDEGTKIAWYKYNHSGWHPWVAWQHGRHLKFM